MVGQGKAEGKRRPKPHGLEREPGVNCEGEDDWTGASKRIKKNQSGFEIVFEALQWYRLEPYGHFAKLPVVGRPGFLLSLIHR